MFPLVHVIKVYICCFNKNKPTSELGVGFELDDQPPVFSDVDPDDLQPGGEHAVRLDACRPGGQRSGQQHKTIILNLALSNIPIYVLEMYKNVHTFNKIMPNLQI